MSERTDGLDFPWPEEGEADALWTVMTREPSEQGLGVDEDEATAWLKAVWREAQREAAGAR